MEGVSCSGHVTESVQQFVNVVVVWSSRCRVTRLFVDVIVVVTHPLLAAAPWRRFQAGAGAMPCRQGYEVGAERHAAHHAVHAAALVLTAGLEILAMLIHASGELARPTLSIS